MATQTGARPRAGTAGLQKPTATVSALWILVTLELLSIVGLRRYFAKHHGG